MKNKLTIQKIRRTAFIFGLLIALGLGALLAQSYYLYQEAQKDFELKQRELESVKKENALLIASIEKFQKEQEDFKQYLFSERDVPAFLDGLAESAGKSEVSVIDMQTQRFQTVDVPEEVKSTKSVFKEKSKESTAEAAAAAALRREQTLTLAAMPIRISIKGTFASVVNFLNELEGYKQLLTVSNVEINNRREYPILSCQFMLRIYSLKTLAELKE